VIKLFSSRQAYLILALILAELMFRIPYFFFSSGPVPDFTNQSAFGGFFNEINRNQNPQFFLSFFIILGQSLHLIYLFEKHEVLYSSTFLPALFYILICSSIPSYSYLSPELVSMSLLLLSLNEIFCMYKSGRERQHTFNAAMYLSFGSLIYSNLIFLFPAMLFAVTFFKFPSWRDYLVSIFGFLSCLYFAFLYYYWTNQTAHFNELFFDSPIRLKFSILSSQSGAVFIFAMWLFLMFLGMLKLYNNFYKNIIKTRLINQILFLVTFLTTFVLLYKNEQSPFTFLIMLIPICFFVSYFFLGRTAYWWKELIGVILVSVIMYFRFV